MERTRAAIHAFANACSKLKPEFNLPDKFKAEFDDIKLAFETKPNPLMDIAKFNYKTATMYCVDNNAVILPLFGKYDKLLGVYPCLHENCEVVEHGNNFFMRYTLPDYETQSIELEKVGIVNQYFYKGKVFGDGNDVLDPTMQLIDTNNQGIINGVKNSSVIRFIGSINNAMIKEEDIEKYRNEFAERNLSSNNTSGLILSDSKFKDLKQVDNKQYLINTNQMKQIDENVYSYFGVNKNILQNSYSEEEWNAFYEGKVEPFAIQLSLVIQNMIFSKEQIKAGCGFSFSTNRLQYASNSTKLNVSKDLFDRGLINRNGVMDIWNMPHVEGGEKYYIRKEYAEVSKLDKQEE